MRKVDNGEKRKYKRKKRDKIMLFVVATNVVPSQPPKRQPTGVPIASANMFVQQITPLIFSALESILILYELNYKVSALQNFLMHYN